MQWLLPFIVQVFHQQSISPNEPFTIAFLDKFPVEIDNMVQLTHVNY